MENDVLPINADVKPPCAPSSPKSNPNDLLRKKELIESGQLNSVIDKYYTLEQIREAHAYVEGFHKRGNVVVRVVEP